MILTQRANQLRQKDQSAGYKQKLAGSYLYQCSFLVETQKANQLRREKSNRCYHPTTHPTHIYNIIHFVYNAKKINYKKMKDRSTCTFRLLISILHFYKKHPSKLISLFVFSTTKSKIVWSICTTKTRNVCLTQAMRKRHVKNKIRNISAS